VIVQLSGQASLSLSHMLRLSRRIRRPLCQCLVRAQCASTVPTKVGAKHHELQSEYESLAKTYPDGSYDPKLGGIDRDIIRRKRIIYRSQQRGWLEVDLLLGNFAKKYVMDMTAIELDEYEKILSQETIDIFNLVTGKDICPPELQSDTLKKLQVYCETNEMRTLPSYQ